MINRINKFLLVISTALVLSLPQLAVALDDAVVVEKPSALAMTGDLVLVRPAMFVVTVLGSAVYLVSLPFALMGGNSAEAGQTLVLKPAETTFIRCLGCKHPGYKRDVREVEGSN